MSAGWVICRWPDREQEQKYNSISTDNFFYSAPNYLLDAQLLSLGVFCLFVLNTISFLQGFWKINIPFLGIDLIQI